MKLLNFGINCPLKSDNDLQFSYSLILRYFAIFKRFFNHLKSRFWNFNFVNIPITFFKLCIDDKKNLRSHKIRPRSLSSYQSAQRKAPQYPSQSTLPNSRDVTIHMTSDAQSKERASEYKNTHLIAFRIG